jgi:hypothetical protein
VSIGGRGDFCPHFHDRAIQRLRALFRWWPAGAGAGGHEFASDDQHGQDCSIHIGPEGTRKRAHRDKKRKAADDDQCVR